MKFSFLSFLFLAPLGYAAVVYNSPWPAFLLAAVINGMVSLIARLFYQYGSGGLWIEIFYFSALSLCFIFIMSDKFAHIRTAYRFILASAAGALSFLVFFLGGRNDTGVAAMIRAQADLLSSVMVSSTGSDAVRRSFLQQMLTPEKIIEAIKVIALRGGALISAFFMFFVNRQAALAAARIFRKQMRRERPLSAFFAPPNTIWVFSSALAAVLLTRLINSSVSQVPGILAWNVLVVCGILFFAQGAGIVMFFLARRTPAFRLITNVLIILAVFSPGINTAALAALLLLGIAENWLPLRKNEELGIKNEE